jgi:hypothetical protein
MIKIGAGLSQSKGKEIIRRETENELRVPGRGLLKIQADVDPQ